MKKTLIIGFILLILLPSNKGTYGQGAEGEPFSYLNPQRPPATPGQTGATAEGQTLYHTHPEFTGIMTTTVTTAAQNTAEGLIFVAPLSQFYDGPAAVMILDDTGEPLYIKTVPNHHFVGDLRKQTVGGTDYLTYHSGTLPGNYTYGSTYVLDQGYQLVDTWTIDNTPRAVLHYDPDPTAVTIHTSWNGATSIVSYDIYAGPTVAGMALVDNTPRTGFETEISLTGLPLDTCFFQSKPVHDQGNPTPFSNMTFRLDLPACWNQLYHSYLPVVRK